MQRTLQEHRTYLQTLPTGFLKVVKGYTANSRWFNSHCRYPIKGLHSYVADKFAFRASVLDHVVLNAPPLGPMKLYRGFCPFDGARMYAVGDVITQTAPTSTTYDRSLAMEFMRKNTCCLLEITVPAGSRGLCLESVSKFPREQEVLLPRGGAFVIQAVQGKKGPKPPRAGVDCSKTTL